MMQEAGKHPVCPRGILRSRSSFLPFIDSADSRTYLLYDITKHRHQFCSLRRTSIHPVGYREQQRYGQLRLDHFRCTLTA
jgi:hypothetical protein